MRARRPAPMILILCFVCLLSLDPQLTAGRCTKDIMRRVEVLRDKSPQLRWLDCRLYTPTDQDYRQQCPSSTLKCFADELNVLTEEWTPFNKIQRKLVIQLKKLAEDFNQMESGCRQCELLRQENATMFLRRLLNTLHMMNSRFC